MNASMRTVVIAVVVSMAMSFPALAAPSSTDHPATSATLRDAAGDVLLSDGNATYAGRELSSRIADFTDPTSQDAFLFQPGHKRSVRINNAQVGGDHPVTCEFSFTRFRSSTVPNWYNVMTIGSSVTADAGFICFEESGNTGRQWRVNYPDLPSECATIERIDATTWRFTVPDGCLATLTTSVKERGKTTEVVQSDVSAPMQITAVVP